MTTSPGIQAPEFDDHTSIFEALNALLKRWRSALGIPLIVTVVVIVLSLFVPNVYTARTSFVPEAPTETNLPAGLAGLAGQLGINFGSEASQSPRFYAEVVKSRAILDRLLTATYGNTLTPENPSDSTTLLTILRKGKRNRPDSLERGAKKLASLISVTVDAQTNIVTVKATLEDRDLSAAVLQRLVSYLNDFNTQTRQSQARERRKFTEQRVASVEQELRDAEEGLKRFYQSNRSWQQSPQLVFEEGQLRRQVDLRQELYRTLRREYETARIQEVNDTPVITVIDSAVPPQRKSGPTRSLWALTALILGGVFALFWAFSAEYFEQAKRTDNEPYRDLVSTAQKVQTELKQTVREVLPMLKTEKKK